METLNTKSGNIPISYLFKPSANPECTVVFLHGFPFDKSTWLKQLCALPDTVQGIAYDIRGFGDSSTDHRFFSINIFAKDLIRLIEDLNLSNCILCGISMGGYIALRASELSPETFKGLILCDTNCAADSNESKIKRFDSIELIHANKKAEFTEGFLTNVFLENTLLNSTDTVEFLRNVILTTQNETICATQLAIASRTDTSHVLSEIKVPTLIIRDEFDKLMLEEQTMHLHKGIFESELVIIPDSGHLPNLDKPDVFNLAINSFLHKHFLS
ncbi:MAG TPA: alpha/beta hydrolase [Pedobacter sp.]|jgi:pimeloyl-ACP methyl ester carboxylesterase